MLAAALLLSAGAASAEDASPVKKPHLDRFKEADANNDGFLTKEEMRAGQEKRLDEMFAKADLDKDGKLSPEEIAKSREEMKKRWKERKDAKGPDGGPPPEPKE